MWSLFTFGKFGRKHAENAGSIVGECDSHAPLPRVVWIELTSKCPFDCVFCSRRLRRGGGVHMNMDLYRRVLAELDKPELIRLNYSGESTHHPQIVEAIRLAADTGAAVELVTALASLPERLVTPLALSGLTRLSLSLHTMDPGQYREIYGHGCLDDVRRRVALLREEWERPGVTRPVFDIAFVAMRRNLDQLMAVADYAESVGAAGLSVHPVIRRDPIAETFPSELERGECLRPEFLHDLEVCLAEVQAVHPGLPVQVSTPERSDECRLDNRPTPYPAQLPEGAYIHTCEQNPFETMHILADGSIVTCEVRDNIAVGRINGHGLRDIWEGTEYRTFRQAFRRGEAEACRTCPYKAAYWPMPPAAAIVAAEGMSASALWGWHPPDGSGLLWSKADAALLLSLPEGARHLRLEGALLATDDSGPNRLTVTCNDLEIGYFDHNKSDPRWIADDLPLPIGALTEAVMIRLSLTRAVVPFRVGLGNDSRALGFGLVRAALM